MAEHLGRSQWSIPVIARNMGLQRKRSLPHHGIEDLDWKIWYLRTFKGMSYREIGEELGISKGVVQGHTTRYGLCLHPPAGPMPDWLKEKMEQKEEEE